jgi:hypothetical protein
MLTNIKGLVDTLDLGAYSGLMPLFEAYSNAIDAVHDRGIGASAGTIRIRLAYVSDLATEAGDTTPVIDGVDVFDNGIGFGDRQLESFEEAYTDAKLKVGGKGVGRFTYLKVFDRVQIRSVFEENGETYRRQFAFSIDREVDLTEQKTAVAEEIGTTVSLRGIRRKYLGSWPKDVDLLAQRIVTHFLIAFASRRTPATYLEAPGHAPIELNRLFDETVQPYIREIPITVGSDILGLQVFRNRDGRGRHDLHYCANGREVVSVKLKEMLPELPEKLLDEDGTSYVLKALVTGDYFDKNANQVRTAIVFKPEDAELDLDEGLLSKREIDQAVQTALRAQLQGDLEQTHKEKFEQIEKFVEQAPEYRVLTNERHRHLLEALPPGLSNDKLDEALLHVRRRIEDSVRKEERSVTALMESETYEIYETRMRELMEDMNDVGKAKLADYVAHRRTILDLLDASLKKVREDGTYPLERVLHKMIFPMGVRSKDVFLEQQNLWVIDERLCFHTLLTSDKKLSSIPGLEGTSKKEPDLFAWFYDTPIGIAEPHDGGGTIVIVEFKKPMRNDYTSDPAAQIIGRFIEIAEGNVKDIDGRPVNPSHIRYIGFLIADLTPTLRKQVKMNYHTAYDNEGYFKTLTEGNGYVEIISYDKLIKDAKRRNRVLFEMLGIHKS